MHAGHPRLPSSADPGLVPMPATRPFTARVKEELASQPVPTPTAARALLAALLRFAGSLHIAGTVGPRFTVVLSTESGAVARLAHRLLGAQGIRTDLRVREPGALAPRTAYEVVVSERVERLLYDVGLRDRTGQPVAGIAAALVRSRQAAACYARGALLARGSVSQPSRPPHLEIGCPSEPVALDLARLLDRLGVPTATSRRGSDLYRVVAKSGERIGRALVTLGAHDAYLAWEDGRIRREVRGEAVRLANADHANLRRSAHAAVAQVDMVHRVIALHGWDVLPPDLAAVARARLDDPQATLSELGGGLDPPRSKGTVLARLRRLAALEPGAARD